MDPDPLIYQPIILAASLLSANEVIIGLTAIGILLFCSGMISASEVGYFSLTAKDMNRLKHGSSKSSKLVQNQLKKPDWLLANILVANNFVNVGIVIISTYISPYLFSGIESPILNFLVQMVGVTFLILMFGEMLPKIIAAKFPLKLAKMMSLPLSIAGKVFFPL
ncbi:MAG: DUF21 domain-containing protein, partial [Bacteroidales bacterium]|nr:DUF21 domain-containing protein [Bacteroidales bacterium]